MLGENHPQAKKERADSLYQRPLIAHLQQRKTPTFDVHRAAAHGIGGSGSVNDLCAMDSQGQRLPYVMTPAPDGTERNTYFYDPSENENGMNVIQSFAKKDKRSTGELLLSYFYYYAFEFDWRRQVVSIRSDDVVLKEEKSKHHGWKRHARLSIEDPFEVGYDVGHVLREDTARRLRREFSRAYLILSGGCGVMGSKALDMLLEVYVDAKEEARKKKESADEKEAGETNGESSKKEGTSNLQ